MCLRIAVMHHERSFFPLDLFERTRGVAEIIWVLDGTSGQDASTRRFLSRLGRVVDIAGIDCNEAADRVAQQHPDGIVSFVDDEIVRAASIAERIGLRYHSPELASVLTDKYAQRQLLGHTGMPGPWFWPVPAGVTSRELEMLGSRIDYPAVLKPVRSSGSRGIRNVHGRADLLQLLGSPDAYIVEEYLPDGDDHPAWAASYLSVESVVSSGDVSHVALTGRFPLAPPFRETGNFIPAIVDEALVPTLLHMVDDAVTTLGIRDSLLHTEIKLTPDGPRLIEVNGRLGGRPGFVLDEVCDVNLFEIAFEVAAGVPVSFDGLVPCDGVGFWLMEQPPVTASVITALGGIDEVCRLPGVRHVDATCLAGGCVDWRAGTDSQVLTVRGAVKDHGDLGELVVRVHDALHVVYA